MHSYSGEYTDLSEKLLKECFFSSEGENVMISPLSILLLLAMASDGVKGSAKTEILRALGTLKAGEILGRFQKEIAGGGAFSSANAVCVRKDMAGFINRGYRDLLKEQYGGKLFSSGDIVRDVNEWVEKHTHGMIRDAAPDSLTDMLLIMMNAVAFEGNWAASYAESDICPREFTNLDGTKAQVQMLCREEIYYVENRHYTGFIKDYREGEFSFVGLLPKKPGEEGLAVAVSRLDLRRLKRETSEITVVTGMPEFAFDYSCELTSVCKSLGIRKIFEDGVDFSPLASAPMKLKALMHKTHIELDRKGTRAFAFSALAAEEDGEGEKAEYRVVILDRPFIFAICWDGIPVFTGVVRHLEDTAAEKK